MGSGATAIRTQVNAPILDSTKAGVGCGAAHRSVFGVLLTRSVARGLVQTRRHADRSAGDAAIPLHAELPRNAHAPDDTDYLSTAMALQDGTPRDQGEVTFVLDD